MIMCAPYHNKTTLLVVFVWVTPGQAEYPKGNLWGQLKHYCLKAGYLFCCPTTDTQTVLTANFQVKLG